VLGADYTPEVIFISWASEAEFAPSFWNGPVARTPLVNEAWVVIWPSTSALRHACKALT
jgi:hypothetical protein